MNPPIRLRFLIVNDRKRGSRNLPSGCGFKGRTTPDPLHPQGHCTLEVGDAATHRALVQKLAQRYPTYAFWGEVMPVDAAGRRVEFAEIFPAVPPAADPQTGAGTAPASEPMPVAAEASAVPQPTIAPPEPAAPPAEKPKRGRPRKAAGKPAPPPSEESTTPASAAPPPPRQSAAEKAANALRAAVEKACASGQQRLSELCVLFGAEEPEIKAAIESSPALQISPRGGWVTLKSE